MELVDKLRGQLLERVPPRIRHQRAKRFVDPLIDTEYHLLDLLVSPGTTAIDIGAHRGLFSYEMQEAGANVIAFEPNRELTSYLQQLLGPSCTVIPAGVSDEAGEADFFVPILGDAEFSTRGSLLQNNEPGLRGTRSMRVLKVKLDDLNLEDVSAIKIDVEGHEMEALRGMTNTLRREQPNLIIESEARHNEANPIAVIDYLAELGYRGFFRHHGALNPVAELDVDKHQSLDNPGTPDYVMNFLFIPDSADPALQPALQDRVASVFELATSATG